MNQVVTEKALTGKPKNEDDEDLQDEIKEQRRKNSPILPDLLSKMAVDIVVSKKSDVWIVHDKPLTETPAWVEYDLDDNTLMLVMRNGKLQSLGVTIKRVIRRHMRKARNVSLLWSKDGDVQDFYLLPLVVRKTGF